MPTGMVLLANWFYISLTTNTEKSRAHNKHNIKDFGKKNISLVVMVATVTKKRSRIAAFPMTKTEC